MQAWSVDDCIKYIVKVEKEIQQTASFLTISVPFQEAVVLVLQHNLMIKLDGMQNFGTFSIHQVGGSSREKPSFLRRGSACLARGEVW